LEHTKSPFRYWYIAMHLLMSTKKSFLVSELQRQLGHKHYQLVWEMHKKLCDVMGKRDDEYQLSGQIELDNAFITILILEDRKDESLKRGTGSQNKSKLLVMTENSMSENPKLGQKPKPLDLHSEID
jgi:hypothetical protein